jgi:hypothetical protein
MSCSKYDLQGLHAGIYIARETNGRFGEYQRFPSTCRPANSFYAILILLAQESHYPTSPETRQVEEYKGAGRCTLVASFRLP